MIQEGKGTHLKIGEFSKLSLLTVKALRFYEKEGLLIPASVDERTGYRLYEPAQLSTAAEIKAYRRLGLSIDQIKSIAAGQDLRTLLNQKAHELEELRRDIDARLSLINNLLEEESMDYSIAVKEIPSAIVYYSEKRLANISDKMQWIPECGAECMRLNPGLKCAEPAYEFCEYLDDEYRETDVLVRHNEAVESFGVESETIKFRSIPATKVLSALFKGSYDRLGEVYASLMNYAAENGYTVSGPARESYIDGIWNKESEDEWLTEVQLPIE